MKKGEIVAEGSAQLAKQIEKRGYGFLESKINSKFSQQAEQIKK
jgi:Fe-S cluster assembly ATPase SufC